MIRCALFVAALNSMWWAPAACQAQAQSLPDEALVIASVGRYGRTPAPIDPLQARIAAGQWKTPTAGDTVTGVDGKERAWTSVPVKDGGLKHQALSGGYAVFTVKADTERVMILDAAGHSSVLVNGEPRVGDVYQTGYVQVPVLLKKGHNEFLFHVQRGSLRAKLVEPKAALQFNLGDVTLPDLIVGKKLDALASVVVLNTTKETISGVHLVSSLGARPIPPIPPLSVAKATLSLAGVIAQDEKPVPFELRLALSDKTLDTARLTLQARKAEQTHNRTFVSEIDGSVQYYAVVPAQLGAEPAAKPGLLLTLHGASVQASGQAAAYGAKSDLHIVAPTNRRPYGFDWEDWGRLDALEVLELAQKELDTDPRRTYLTGHSMGGHGTWHVGVTFPDRFAAIAPSAGWVSMWSYAGAKKATPTSPVEELVQRAANPSDTVALARNYAQHGVYVLHGDADDNVPVGQARTMRKLLSEFHADFAYYEERGAGHWWGKPGFKGAACVDWPEMFDFFGRRQIPRRSDVHSVDFRSANPAVSGWCHWAGIDAQRKPLAMSNVKLRLDPAKRRLDGSTDNVARLVLDLGHLTDKGTLSIRLDDDKLDNVRWPKSRDRLWLEKDGESWKAIAPPALSQKGMHRCGPFREVFRNRMAFVYGTTGTPEENAWSLAKARYDAEQFWYRGNGAIEVIPDAAFDAKKEPERNVILYGNADTNSAWQALLGAAPIQVRRGKLIAGKQERTADDLACLFIQPRPGSDRALVGAVSGTGLHGMRLTDRLPLFISGVAYPDWIVLDGASLTRGLEGIAGAGYFGPDWKIETGDSAWRGEPGA